MELKLDRSLVVFGEEGSAKRTIVWRAAYLRARIGTHGAHLVHVSAGDGQLAADDAITTSVLVHFKKVTIYSV